MSAVPTTQTAGRHRTDGVGADSTAGGSWSSLHHTATLLSLDDAWWRARWERRRQRPMLRHLACCTSAT